MSEQIAYLAGGCFWGVEELFRNLHGVIDTEVGYMGGTQANPTYRAHEGHAEAIAINYDPEIISYEELLKFFFQIHNPTTENRQGNDIGTSYRSAIFCQNENEKQIAQNLIARINASGKWGANVATKIEPLCEFYPAEDYHQDYLQHNPNGYSCHYIRKNWVLED